MHQPLTQFAAAQAESNMLDSLGIDLKLLAFQVVAFLLLVIVLGKFVFPVFFRIIDKRQADIEESARAAAESSEHADKVKAEVDAMLKKARREATEIVSTAKTEAEAMVADAESKAKTNAEHILASAREDIDKEIVAAKKQLHNESIDLVVAAAEKVLGTHVDAKLDKKVVETSLREVRS